MDLNDFIREWLKSWTGNRPDGLLEYYAEEAFYADPAHPAGLVGHEALRAYFTKLLARNPDWIWQAAEITPTEKGCTLKWKARIPAGNQTLELFGLDIVEISNGKITRNEVYFDRVPWMKALGS